MLQSQAARQSMPKRDGLERSGEDRKGELCTGASILIKPKWHPHGTHAGKLDLEPVGVLSAPPSSPVSRPPFRGTELRVCSP